MSFTVRKRLCFGVVSFPVRALGLLGILSGGMFAHAALAAAITAASPVNGTYVSSPVWIRAHNVGCDGLAPTSFGYWIDNATAVAAGVTAYDIDVPKQALATGTHTVHFKSGTTKGACPAVRSTFIVSGSNTPDPSTGAEPGIPSYAIPSPDLDGEKNWLQIHDGGTPGESRGSTVYPATTPSYDDAREFYMSYGDHGGERWSLQFAREAAATHFILDTYVYLTDPAQVQNLELDLNQVMPNGETVILGTQCSSLTGTWESAYTSGHYDHWWSSNIRCNPRTWTANQWHHIQIAMHRDDKGVVTHDWVNLDGAHNVFTSAPRVAAQALGWGPGDLVVNYQIEGENAGIGSIKSYIHKMTVYRW